MTLSATRLVSEPDNDNDEKSVEQLEAELAAIRALKRQTERSMGQDQLTLRPTASGSRRM